MAESINSIKSCSQKVKARPHGNLGTRGTVKESELEEIQTVQ
jgi:hypothetical protein